MKFLCFLFTNVSEPESSPVVLSHSQNDNSVFDFEETETSPKVNLEEIVIDLEQTPPVPPVHFPPSQVSVVLLLTCSKLVVVRVSQTSQFHFVGVQKHRFSAD